MSKLDDAISADITDDRGQAVVVGWALIIEYVVPETEARTSTMRTRTPDGQLVSTTIGLHTMAMEYHKGTLAMQRDGD
jgi:hypothetical protein